MKHTKIYCLIVLLLVIAWNAWADGVHETLSASIDYSQESNVYAVWLLDELTNTDSALDSTANSFDLADTGTPEPAVGKFGGARSCNAVDNAGFTSTIAANFASNSNILVMGWVKANATNGAIVAESSTNEVVLRIEGNKGQFILNSFSTNDRVSGATTINDDAWHHVAGFWDGTNIYVYVDGVDDTAGGLATSGSWAGVSGANWGIGTFAGTEITADLDECAIFNNTDSKIATKAQIDTIIANVYANGLKGDQ